MTTTRPGVAVKPARSRLADRDEYPALGAVATLDPRPGIVMGPTPRVHLGICSLVVPIRPMPLRQNVISPISAMLAETTPAPAELPSPDPGPTIPEIVDAVVRPEPFLDVSHVAERPATRDIVEWKPVDPQTARDALRVERDVEIPRGRHRTRTPRLPQLSTGDAAERIGRLVIMDRRRRVFMIAASILVIVGLLVSIWRFTNVGYAAQPATSWNQVVLPETTAGTPAASQTPSASAKPSASPSTAEVTTQTVPATTEATKGSQVSAILRDNPVYDQPIVGSCPGQSKPTTLAESQAAMNAYVDCMNTVWGSILGSASNFRFRPASIFFYVNTVVNPCQTLRTSDAISAMYCPSDATIYVSPTGVANGVGSRFYGAELVTHEYAHHVQSLTQILSNAQKEGWGANEYSRRVQLQAHCLSFAVLTHVDGFEPDPAIFRLGWQVGPGSDTYGSIASLQYWGEKGMNATKVGDCETYSVPKSDVA